MTIAERAATNPEDAWDARTLGHDEKFAKRAGRSSEAALDKALGLQLISIRLQRELLKDLKFIATAHNIGYQPLIRDILSRFVVHEKKAIRREAMERLKLQLAEEQAARDAAPKPRAKRAA